MIDTILKLPPLPPTAAPTPIGAPQKLGLPTKAGQPAFADVLEGQVSHGEPLSFSAHARSRLATRSIELNTQQMVRLANGVEQAAQKGARDSLVMMDNLAFIVSVRNRTIVTAMDGAAQQGNVFTQIDSAVIV